MPIKIIRKGFKYFFLDIKIGDWTLNFFSSIGRKVEYFFGRDAAKFRDPRKTQLHRENGNFDGFIIHCLPESLTKNFT